MTPTRNWTAVIIGLIAAVLIWSDRAAGELKPPSADEIQKMEQAAPAKSFAAAQKPRKLLVFNRTEGFEHDSILFVAKAVEILGAKTGAFTTEVSTDMEAFRPENLSQFDGILFNNTTDLKFEDPALRKSLMDFVRGGKGIIGIHAATDNFYTWPEAAEMMGGLFNSHPWTSGGDWVFKVEDPTNPVAAPLGAKPFTLSDEIYLIVSPFSRRNVRVLVSLDLTDPKNLKPIADKSEIFDAPVSWVRSYGQGRVFYCSLGHNKPLMWNPAVLGHYLAGIQYALGDLAADDKPLYLEWEFQNSLDNIRKYDYGQNDRYLNAIGQAVRDAGGVNDVERKMEKAMIEFLKADTSLPAKQFICRQLRVIGSAECVAVLAPMLSKPETSDMARYAIERIASPAVDDALLAALPQASGNAKIGIINSLGVRKSTRAVEALGALTHFADVGLAGAADEALGHIADEASCRILAGAVDNTTGPLQIKVCDAYLKCADRLAETDKKSQAIKIYQQMNEPARPAVIRLAAIRGLIVCDDDPGAMILKVLKEGDVPAQAVAMGLLGQLHDVKNLKEIAALLPKLSPETQVQLLSAFGQLGDSTVKDEVTGAVQSENLPVRLAAMTALANLGDDSAVLLLAKAAAGAASPQEKETARQGLYGIRSTRADEVIVKAIPTAETKVKIELILSVSRRNIGSAAETLFQTATDPEQKVRIESFRSLRRIATSDNIPRLIDLLKTEKIASVRSEAELSLQEACVSIRDEKRRSEPVVAAYQQSKEPAFRCSMLNVLGLLQDDSKLDVLLAAAKDEDLEVRRDAVRVLSDWPNPKPMPNLKEASTARSQPENVRVFAALGYVRMIGMDPQIGSDAKIDLYRDAMKAYDNLKVKNLVLSELSKTSSLKALQMASEYLQDEQLKKEAEAAMQKIVETNLKSLPPAGKSIIIRTLQE